MVGKDILRFHSIYWPILFMMLGELPDRLIAHGWFVAKDGKMSKSGAERRLPWNASRTLVDWIHFVTNTFMCVAFQSVQMEPSLQKTMSATNYELATDLGNLNRTVSMINKYFDGQILPM